MNESNDYQNLYASESQGILEAPMQAMPAEPKPEVHYSASEQICAFLAMLAGFLFNQI